MKKQRIYKNRDFYNRLNRKEKRKFKKAFLQQNNINYFNSFLNEKSSNFEYFMLSGFVWEQLKQGHEYWDNLSVKY